MKKLYLIAFSYLISLSGFSQDISGTWYGALDVFGTQLRLVFHIDETDEGFKTTMDSPDQGAKGIPVTTTTFDGATLRLGIAAAGIEYYGTLEDAEQITGHFKQGGQTFALALSREIIEKTVPNRPQEPVAPFPYYAEDVTFHNPSAAISLAGTLTLPHRKGVFPVAILISGSGPQDRNEEVAGHKPFWVLADHLTRNGVAVLRFDDRGTAQSEGNFTTATSLDFATDVEAAIAYLQTRQDIDPTKIGLIGHSEGGLIAPLVAERNKEVAYIVLLAGPGIPGDALLLLQYEQIAKTAGVDATTIREQLAVNAGAFAVAKKAMPEEVYEKLQAYFLENPGMGKPAEMENERFAELQAREYGSPWMHFFIKHDPVEPLKNTRCPVLAINGEKDLQVPPKENLHAIEQALKKAGNKNVTVLELPNLNHLFQNCETGLPNEYGSLEETFAPTALKVVSDWVRKTVE